ncbi:MAG: hypothetical protein CUN55_03540 [Phototrophicales bacterium]|nr:MAG: hypothetical protein CUN55_03540 [Phototrophicales bacterium]
MPNLSTRWQQVHPTLPIYQYDPTPATKAKACPPILMLHSSLSSRRSWGVMSAYFKEYGLEKLYALELSELQNGLPPRQVFQELESTIDFLLNDRHPRDQRIILIGHGTGGLVAYRYWQASKQPNTIGALFVIGTPHDTTVFPLLPEEVGRKGPIPPIDAKTTMTIPINFSKIRALYASSSTLVINIIGHQIGPDFDGVVRGEHTSIAFEHLSQNPNIRDTFDGTINGLRLPEAVNEVFRVHRQNEHFRLNKDKRVFDFILSCLRGEYYQVKLKLVGLQLKSTGNNDLIGPIAFEVNGNRMPADSAFYGEPNHLYLFEDSVPPLCTLHYPVTNISCAITLHLKDLSNQRGKRRRMYTRLYIPLRQEGSIAHAMQDSEGSDYTWRIVVERMPRLLHDPAIPDLRPELPRGI